MRWAVGILDRVKFWKHDDEPVSSPPEYDLGARQFDTSNPTGVPPMGMDPMAQHDPMQPSSLQQQGDAMFGQEQQPRQYPSYPQQYPQSTPFPGTAQQVPQQQYSAPEHHEPSIHPRDIELILEKLDGIKSELRDVQRRLASIEQTTTTKEQQKKYW